MEDYFQSHTLSTILTWLFSIPLIIMIFIYPISMLFEKIEGHRFFIIWMFVCAVLFGPLRYMVLQLFVAIAYPFQSLRALVTLFILVIYIPIVFGILYIIGVALPFLSAFAIVGFKETISSLRLWLAVIAAPIIFLIATFLFHLVLPYASYSTHWLRAEDVVRATNGPSEYFYRFIVEPIDPIIFPNYVNEMGYDNLSSKERLRSHVATLYLGKEEFSFFVYKSYPEEFKRKTGYSK